MLRIPQHWMISPTPAIRRRWMRKSFDFVGVDVMDVWELPSWPLLVNHNSTELTNHKVCFSVFMKLIKHQLELCAWGVWRQSLPCYVKYACRVPSLKQQETETQRDLVYNPAINYVGRKICFLMWWYTCQPAVPIAASRFPWTSRREYKPLNHAVSWAGDKTQTSKSNQPCFYRDNHHSLWHNPKHIHTMLQASAIVPVPFCQSSTLVTPQLPW